MLLKGDRGAVQFRRKLRLRMTTLYVFGVLQYQNTRKKCVGVLTQGLRTLLRL